MEIILWNLYGILYRKPLYHIHKPLVSRYRYYRLTGILTLSMTSDSKLINKLLDETNKPTLDFAARCLDIQNLYSRFPIQKVLSGLFFIYPNPHPKPPAIVTILVRAIKNPPGKSEREKHNNMQQQHNTLRAVPCKSHLAGHCYTWVQIALLVVHRYTASTWFAFQRTVSPLTVRVRLLDLLASSP